MILLPNYLQWVCLSNYLHHYITLNGCWWYGILTKHIQKHYLFLGLIICTCSQSKSNVYNLIFILYWVSISLQSHVYHCYSTNEYVHVSMCICVIEREFVHLCVHVQRWHYHTQESFTLGRLSTRKRGGEWRRRRNSVAYLSGSQLDC